MQRRPIRIGRATGPHTLLKQRLADLNPGRVSGAAEERVMFEELTADCLQERAIRCVDRKA